MTTEFIRKVARENAVDTRNYHYWMQYEDDYAVIYRVPQARFIYGLARCEPDAFRIDYSVIKGC